MIPNRAPLNTRWCSHRKLCVRFEKCGMHDWVTLQSACISIKCYTSEASGVVFSIEFMINSTPVEICMNRVHKRNNHYRATTTKARTPSMDQSLPPFRITTIFGYVPRSFSLHIRASTKHEKQRVCVSVWGSNAESLYADVSRNTLRTKFRCLKSSWIRELSRAIVFGLSLCVCACESVLFYTHIHSDTAAWCHICNTKTRPSNNAHGLPFPVTWQVCRNLSCSREYKWTPEFKFLVCVCACVWAKSTWGLRMCGCSPLLSRSDARS